VLGRSAVLGSRVWDVQHKFRIVMGPLCAEQYRRFLPGRPDLARLQALVRHWVGIEFAWDLKLILRRDEVPAFALGDQRMPLGHASWVGRYRRTTDADDLCIDVERLRAARAAPTTLPSTADFSYWPRETTPAHA
jgi:type VI secretion system protein ImpH